MSVQELHQRALEEFDRRVRAIGDDQWNLPTPCTEWDVRALVNHLVYENRWIPPLFAGKSVQEVGDQLEGDLLGDDPKGAWAESMREALAVVQTPGAMERRIQLSRGPTPAQDYAAELMTDAFIHAWDLARAIGADERLDPKLVELCYDQLKPMEEALKKSGQFGQKIEPPAEADLQTKLLAVMGRRA